MLITDIFAYQGVGYGQTRQEAINSALNDIASQISISINSSTTVHKISSTTDYSKEVQNIINTEIPEIAFQNYSILEDKKAKEYFIRLEVNGTKLAATYARELDRKLEDITQQLNSYSSKFKKYSVLKNAGIRKLFLSMKLIYAIDSTYNISSYKQQIKYLNQEKNRYINELSFVLHSNNQKVRESVSSLLNNMGLIGSSNGNIVFNINLGNIVKKKFDAKYTGKTYAMIEIIENQKVIYSKRVKLFGETYIEEYLIDRILKQLEKKLDKVLKEILS